MLHQLASNKLWYLTQTCELRMACGWKYLPKLSYTCFWRAVVYIVNQTTKCTNQNYSYPNIFTPNLFLNLKLHTVRTAHFKSLGSDVGEIKKMFVKFLKKSVLTPRNVREKSNTVFSVIDYKTPPSTSRRREIKKWDISLYLYVLEICI